MKINGFKETIFGMPFFNPKKCICPFCNSPLKVIYVKRIVNAKSKEAVNFNFYGWRGFGIGNVIFKWNELLCEKCRFQISVENMYILEKKKKRPNRFISAVKYINNADAEYVYTKHKERPCPYCWGKMYSTFDSEDVDCNAQEKSGICSINGKPVEGTIEVRDGYFICRECDAKIPFAEMKKLETGTY